MLLFLTLLIQVPTIIDGDLDIKMQHGGRSGAPVLVVNDETLLTYGQGPKEVMPHTQHYDWLTQTAMLSSSFRVFWWSKSEGLKFEKIPDAHSMSLAGSWGRYRITVHLDYKKNRSKGGRITLDSGDESILLAEITPMQAAMHSLTRFYAGREALVVVDNIARAIGYLPLVDGQVQTEKNPKGALVPPGMLWFPMPHAFRENPVKIEMNNPNDNLLMARAMAIGHGLYYFCANNERGYIYDLENTSSYYIGHVTMTGCPVGTKGDRLIIYHPDDGLIEIEPLQLVIN